ncbi:MAG: BatA and WFA domain-containing protein [Anaerolineae bacterium]|nr:BatA and WFA domain-containing protein [Anaerolineae bacterium]
MMTFLSPLAFALLALIPPIIALYLLKLRRQDYEVSSIYLWQRVVRDVEANAPWQRLRRNLLLLLQILFLLLLILALVRPATPTEGAAGQSVVLVLDRSASMAATDEVGPLGQPGSRLEAAKQAAAEMVTNLPETARVTVIAAAGGQADLLTSATQDPRQALSAIDSIQPTLLNSDLDPALTLAEAIVAREPNAEIIMLSDGAITPPPGSSARLVSFGKLDANQAISTLSISPVADGQLALFVQASNYGSAAAQRRLIVEVDGAPFAAVDLDLPPAGHVEQVIEAIPPEAETVEAYLQPSDEDVLPWDDRARLVVRPVEPARVTVVTNGNFFLQTALSLLDGRRVGVAVETTTVAPANLLPDQAATSPDDLKSVHIFDRTVPETLPPGNLLLIAPPQSVAGLFDITGQIDNPALEVVQPDHPLVDNISLADTQILATQVISAGSWARTVVVGYPDPAQPDSRPIPLLLAGEIDGRRIAILAFDLHQSDLPLRPAFPILMANLIRYLAPGAGGVIPAQIAPGQPLAITLPAGVARARLIYPNGAVQAIEAGAGQTLPVLSQLGLYTLEFEPPDNQPGDQVRFAVNFFDPVESAIMPQPDLALTGRNREQTAQAALPPAYREWWRLLAAGALLLLVAEWLVYRRSVAIRWWSGLKYRIFVRS